MLRPHQKTVVPFLNVKVVSQVFIINKKIQA